MACCDKHIKFFRFCGYAYVDGYNRDSINWLFAAADLIDFNYEILIKDVIVIGQLTNGGFSFTAICDMYFDVYLLLRNETLRIQKDIEAGNE